jgi:lauroyl/myristoyl acyltransferase
MLSLLVERLCKTRVFVVGLASVSVDFFGITNSTTTVFTQLSQTLYAALYTPKASLIPSVRWSLYTQSPALVIKTKFI